MFIFYNFVRRGFKHFFVQLFPGKISAYATNYTLCSFPRSKIGESFATILTTFGRQYQHCIRSGWPNICNKNKLVKSTSALVNFFCFTVFLLVRVCFIVKVSSDSRLKILKRTSFKIVCNAFW